MKRGNSFLIVSGSFLLLFSLPFLRKKKFFYFTFLTSLSTSIILIPFHTWVINRVTAGIKWWLFHIRQDFQSPFANIRSTHVWFNIRDRNSGKEKQKETKTYQNSNNKNSLIFLVKIQNAERSTCWNISILEGTRYQIIRFLNEALIFTSISLKIFFFWRDFESKKKSKKRKIFRLSPRSKKPWQFR